MRQKYTVWRAGQRNFTNTGRKTDENIYLNTYSQLQGTTGHSAASQKCQEVSHNNLKAVLSQQYNVKW